MRFVLRLILCVLGLWQHQALSDSSSSSVERAQKWMLQGQRVKAVETLVMAIRKESNGSNRKNLRSIANSFSRDFLTEKGQRLFEVGLTLQKSNPTLSIAKFKEALAEEDSNALVMTALARSYLITKKCEEAKLAVEPGILMNPFFVDAIEVHARAAVCLNEKDTAKADLASLEREDISSWRLKWIRSQMALAESSVNARALLEQLHRDVPAFPEPIFQLWKATERWTRSREEFGKRYIALCKALSADQKEEYRFEPNLCGHIEEVQADLEQQQKHLDEQDDK